MPLTDLHLRPLPPPTASSPLLSAALGGLLWLASSCSPSSDGVSPDSGADRDLGTSADTGAASDTGASSDTGTGSDTGTAADTGAGADTGVGDDASVPLDAGTPTDAGSTTDAMALMDASLPADGGGPIDGGPRDAPCDVLPDRMITATDAAPGMTLADFTTMCDGLGGFVEIHPHCGGMNTCGGISYDSGTGTLTEHTCAGLNTCTGFSCVLP